MIQIIRLNRQTYGIRSGFSDVVRFECKATPGMRWDDPNKAWIGYGDAVAVTAARLRARGLKVQGEVDGRIGIPTMPAASVGLRDYQNKGVEFLISKAKEGVILADDLGLGKGCQAITAARALKRKTVVVCPSFVRGVWDAELPKWWPAAKTQGLKGVRPSSIEGDPDVVLVHYDILYAWVDALIQWGAETFIADEAHYLMGSKSRRTNAAQKLAATCAYRMLLTGTPMNSKIIDLWAPVETVSPGRFGKWFGFALRYTAARQEQIEIRVEGVKTTRNIWKFDGSSNLDELNARLRYFMLRRLKSDVALELPARTRQILSLEVDKKHIIAPTAALKSDKLLRQALDRAADGKIPQVIDLIDSHITAGHKVVLFSYRKAIASAILDGALQKRPLKAYLITGDTPQAKRKKIVADAPDLLCATMDSTGVGIDLSYADVGVFAELDWVPSKLVQCEGRLHRFGQTRNVLIQYCCARGTGDDLIRRVVLAKLDKFAGAIGKTDDKLHEDLKGLEGSSAAERMQKLYERLKADE